MVLVELAQGMEQSVQLVGQVDDLVLLGVDGVFHSLRLLVDETGEGLDVGCWVAHWGKLLGQNVAGSQEDGPAFAGSHVHIKPKRGGHMIAHIVGHIQLDRGRLNLVTNHTLFVHTQDEFSCVTCSLVVHRIGLPVRGKETTMLVGGDVYPVIGYGICPSLLSNLKRPTAMASVTDGILVEIGFDDGDLMNQVIGDDGLGFAGDGSQQE